MSPSSSSSSMIVKNPTPPVQRRLAQYHPTIWGPKLIDSFTTQYNYEVHGMRLEVLKKEVVSALLAASNTTKDDTASTFSVLKLIDSMQRLGVAYHFEKEIEAAITSLASTTSVTAKNDLRTVALKFRILKQHGISISPDVFNKFRSEDGSFKDDLSKDVEGLLSLYEASHLGMLGEDDVLEEAKNFSIKNLKKYLKANSDEDENDDDFLNQLVQQSLETPLHWRMPRIEARNSIDMYQRDNSKNLALLELAKLDYNLVQSLYQREIKELSRWWRELDFIGKASFSRDRLMENYLWAMGINYEPQFSECRIGLTKFVCIFSSVDDMYDVYGFLDELECFTHAVCRWSLEAMEELPDYMKPIYGAMLNFGNELADNVFINNGLNVLPHLKEEWENLCKTYLVEARWFYGKYTPSVDEYLENSWTSVGGPAAIRHAYLLQGCQLTRSSLESFNNGSQMIYWASLMTRLSDDLGTSKAERERGDVAKSVDCYMEQEGVSEEEAQNYIKDLICCCWKKMNEEMMSSKNSNIPKLLVNLSLNMARSAHSIFQHGDGIGTSIGVTKDRLISLIANHIPIDSYN